MPEKESKRCEFCKEWLWAYKPCATLEEAAIECDYDPNGYGEDPAKNPKSPEGEL